MPALTPIEMIIATLFVVLLFLIYFLFIRQKSEQQLNQQFRQDIELKQQTVLQQLSDEVKEVRVVQRDLMGKIDEVESAIAELAESQRKQAAEPAENRVYGRAAKMVSLGASLDEIMQECDLPRAEAELLMSMHQRN